VEPPELDEVEEPDPDELVDPEELVSPAKSCAVFSNAASNAEPSR
jgi:hypothetical protein